VTKDYQRTEFDTSPLAVPERVSIAMAEIAEDMREGLLALAVGAGLQVMTELMQADVAALCGPRGKHDPQRAATRHGSGRGSVTLGGRRVPVTRPRVRAADGSGELPVPAYELFTGTEVLGRMAMERMLAGLSTRRYGVGLEPVGEQVSEAATATSKSAVSRKFVAMTEHALADLLAADLSQLELVALMVDGVRFAEHLCVVALGIDIDGVKHPLALAEGSTENTTLVRGLLVGLRERGLDVTKPILAVLDGAKALRVAVLEVFDHPVLARCQLHKIRNVRDHLPERLRGPVERRMREASHAPSALDAQARLEALAAELGKDPPGCGGQPAGRPGRDPHRAAPGRAAHPGPHPALHQRDRIDDLHLPGARQERQTLAGRADGAALVRRRHARSRQAVPPGERAPAPARPTRRAGAACRLYATKRGWRPLIRGVKGVCQSTPQSRSSRSL
jgi:putative transposase